MMHAIAAKAVCFAEALDPSFQVYGQRVVDNAQALAATLEAEGARIVSGGTDNHLLLVDLTPLKCTGQEAEEALGRVGITVNKNAIPNDPLPPRVTSGLRLGTPAVSTRGFGVEELQSVAHLIMKTINHRGDGQVEQAVREEVLALTGKFPVPGLEQDS
jgi:glycine hydroxymethyltransferase